MGIITIQTSGSFQSQTKTFRADRHGHADAVAQAIEWLVGEVLPESTNLALVSWGPRGMKGGTEFRTLPAV